MVTANAPLQITKAAVASCSKRVVKRYMGNILRKAQRHPVCLGAVGVAEGLRPTGVRR